ncbi:hypothetical protein ZIOFF_042920 [Zingiber officinale]|uniref:Uncharacterized protein n=1 Tax=Zingiber officinale TaxID=94328 RepID=A0A8J5KTQ9_ZINOF|nr:hypothetical protein ZIOFF_042920 [Zingiber officinale]
MSWDSLIEGVVRGEAKRWGELVAGYHNYSSKNGLRVVASEAGKEDIMEEEKKVTAVRMMRVTYANNTSGKLKIQVPVLYLKVYDDVPELQSNQAVSCYVMTLFQSQLNEAILREDYGEAAKLKLAITSATKKDIVGAALTIMNV